jgi:hypothetical protein
VAVLERFSSVLITLCSYRQVPDSVRRLRSKQNTFQKLDLNVKEPQQLSVSLTDPQEWVPPPLSNTQCALFGTLRNGKQVLIKTIITTLKKPIYTRHKETA